MLKKQNQLRSILDQIYYHTNYHRSLMSYSIPTDLFSFSNGLHSRIPLSSSGNFFSFQNNATCTSSTSNSFLRIKGKTNGFVLRGCFDSNQPKAAAASAAGHKPGAFAYQRIPQLEIEDCSTDAARLINGRGSSERGNPLGFFDNSLPEKLLVAVDVDEVLGNFVSALNRFIADRYLQNHSVSEYHVYEFFKIWNCSRDEADIRVHEFFKTPYFKTGIHPLPGAQKALHKLSQFCNLSVVTSRQNVIKDHTIEWIQKHYPGLFQEIHFGNHFALDGESRPKSEICRSLGAKVLIDDNPRYAIECAEVGIRVLLFDYENSYPWCKTDSVNQHSLVTKVHNWEEVEQQLVSWIVS